MDANKTLKHKQNIDRGIIKIAVFFRLLVFYNAKHDALIPLHELCEINACRQPVAEFDGGGRLESMQPQWLAR